MTRSRRVPQKRAGVRIRTLGLPALMGAVMIVRGQTAPSPATQAKQTASNLSADPAEPLGKKAWHILREGLKDKNADKRAKAVRALGLLTGNAEAEKAAALGRKDEKPNVRVAAAAALGSMRAHKAAGNLEEALGDSEPSVVLAAANSLLLLHDDVGYDRTARC